MTQQEYARRIDPVWRLVSRVCATLPKGGLANAQRRAMCAQLLMSRSLGWWEAADKCAKDCAIHTAKGG